MALCQASLSFLCRQKTVDIGFFYSSLRDIVHHQPSCVLGSRLRAGQRPLFRKCLVTRCQMFQFFPYFLVFRTKKDRTWFHGRSPAVSRILSARQSPMICTSFVRPDLPWKIAQFLFTTRWVQTGYCISTVCIFVALRFDRVLTMSPLH